MPTPTDNNAYKVLNSSAPAGSTGCEADQIKNLIGFNRSLRRRVYRLHNLVEVSFQMNAAMEESQIINTYLLNLFGLISTRSILILAGKTPLSKKFTPVYFQGLGADEANRMSIRSSDPIFRILGLHNNCLAISKHTHLLDTSPYLRTVAELDGQLLSPLVHREHQFGMVIVGNRHNQTPYTTAEIEIFALLTNFLAVALSNARMYKEMERISLTDPLTGLFNRRYFENYLQTEIARARRFNHPLSLVMLDVDHFKNYNDQLGHLNGDRLLRNLAGVLNKTVRNTDSVARYGGEEFCVILPEVSKEGAHLFSERLRNTIFSHPFKKREVQPNGHVSVSLGAATFPMDAQMTKELVEKADIAMYKAKKKGRNRVALFDER